MFSDKTTFLVRVARVPRLSKVVAFKPATDTRSEGLTSHNGDSFPAVTVTSAKEILEAVSDGRIILIDEGQFFDDDLVGVAHQLSSEGRRVVIAGLNLDFRGEPFPVIAALAMEADKVTCLKATCAVCGEPATRSQRLTGDEAVVMVGGADLYEPRCRGCYEVP